SESSRGSHSGDRGRGEGECHALRKTRELPVQALANELILFLPLLAVLPLLQRDEEEGVVARPRQAEEAEPDDAGRRLHPGSLCQQLFDLARGGLSPLQRGGARKLQVQVEESLVFVREEARWQPAAQESGE